MVDTSTRKQRRRGASPHATNCESANLTVKKDSEPYVKEAHHWNIEGSSGEINAQGVLLHFLHMKNTNAFPVQKLHTSLRTSPGPLGEIYCHCAESYPGHNTNAENAVDSTSRGMWLPMVSGYGSV